MSKIIKTFNLREGAFPIKMDLIMENINFQDIGRLKDSISGEIEITMVSKDIRTSLSNLKLLKTQGELTKEKK